MVGVNRAFQEFGGKEGRVDECMKLLHNLTGEDSPRCQAGKGFSPTLLTQNPLAGNAKGGTDKPCAIPVKHGLSPNF